MDSATLATLLDGDVDDLSKAMIGLDRDDRRQTLQMAAEMLPGHREEILPILKILRLVQAALSDERNGQFPVAQARALSTAVMAAAGETDAQDVHRATVDVMSLLAVKADAERNNLRVLAQLMEKSPRDPLGYYVRETSKSTTDHTATSETSIPRNTNMKTLREMLEKAAAAKQKDVVAERKRGA